MMKILLTAVFVFLSVTYGQCASLIGSGIPVEAGEVVCTGGANPIFYWDMEHITDVTSGTPAGCSAGDDVGLNVNAELSTTAGTVTNGTYSILFPTGYDHVEFDVSSGDIIDGDEGTITFDVTCADWSIEPALFRSTDGTVDNMILVRVDNSTVRAEYDGSGTGLNITHGNTPLTNNQKYSVEYKWRIGTTNPSVSLNIDDGTAVTSDTDLTQMSSSLTKLFIGNQGFPAASNCWIDNLKVYDSWQ